MNNIKLFVKFFLLSLAFSLSIFFITDFLAFREVSNLEVIIRLGYKNSLLFYEDRNKALIIIFLISLTETCILFFNSKKKQQEIQNQEDALLNALKNITEGQDVPADKNIYLKNFYNYIYKIVRRIKLNADMVKNEKESIKISTENIAHQVKTSIATITVIVENNHPNDTELKRELDHINLLLSDMLQSARVKSGQVEYKKEKISAKDILYTAIDNLSEIYPKITFDIEGSDFLLIGDFYWLTEAFINLLKNAKEHAKSHIDIRLSTTELYKEILITDDGKGFSKEDTIKIFKRYYREKEDNKGFGIGLSMSEMIFTSHHASVIAKSGNGGIFLIKFFPYAEDIYENFGG